MRKNLIKLMSGILLSMAVLVAPAIGPAKAHDFRSERTEIHVSSELELRSAIFKGNFKSKNISIVLDNDITVGAPIGYVNSKVTLYKNGHSLREIYTIDHSMGIDQTEGDSEYTEIGICEIDL